MRPLLVWKAYKLKRAYKGFIRARENAIKVHRGQRPRYPWYEEAWSWTVNGLKRYICSAFCPCLVRAMKRKEAEQELSDKFLRNPFVDGTIENITLKSFLGFVSGMFLTFVAYFFFTNTLNMNPKVTTLLCCVLAISLSSGLAFSENVRCITMLSVPVLFSNRGRMVLMAYTYILVMSGPTKNAMRNANILVDAINCGQEILIKQTKAMLKTIFAPLLAIIDVMRDILQALKDFARQMKEAFLAIRDLFLEIIAAIKSVFGWLLSIVNICDKTYGSPYERCNKAFDDAIEDCRNKLGFFGFLCYIVSAIKYICEVARIVDLLCAIPAAIKSGIIEPIKEQIKTFARHMYNQFYVNVTFIHYYNYSLEQSRSFEDIRGDIADEIEKRTEWFIAAIDWSDFVMAFFFFFVVFKAYVYRLRYLSSDAFDNVYITLLVQDIDDRRVMMDKETIFPLSFREKRRYVPTFSLRMVQFERRNLVVAGSLLLLSGLQMSFYMILDYSLYHLLRMIRYYGRIEAKGKMPALMQISVKEGGVMADMYRQMITRFDPLMKSTPEFDTAKCLPTPVPLDLNRYQMIGILYGLCILLAVTESYGLRLRHVICGTYYPAREKARAVWLYNKILKSRGSITKYLRRQIRRKVNGDESIEKISLVDRLSSQFPLFDRVARALGFSKIQCLCCNESGDPEDFVNFKRCVSPGCKGLYCYSCFAEIKNVCTLCMNPVEYGDLSDVSEERDSSEEESEEDDTDHPTDTIEISDEEPDKAYQFEEGQQSQTEEPQRLSFLDVEANPVHIDLATLSDFSDSDQEKEDWSDV